MKPRKATEADISEILPFLRAFHEASGEAFGFDDDAAAVFLAGMIDKGVVLMAPRGVIGGVVAPSPYDPSWRMAVELFWWGRGDGLALLRAFEAWASEQGANEIRMSTLAAFPRSERVLEAKGYARSEINFRKAI